MSSRPVFVATHPRACSTAFERVFMTRRKSIQTIHEPFGDAFYYGPERMGTRFEGEKWEQERLDSGFSESTFKTIMERIERESSEGKRVFIKDITHYLLPPNGQATAIAPSLKRVKRGVGTNGLPVFETDAPLQEGKDVDSDHDSGVAFTPSAGSPSSGPKSPPFPFKGSAPEASNPTVVPREMLEKFHFTFLIRHPKNSIPSYYRCCIPPLVDRTGFTPFMPEEAGYDELRRMFDYLKDSGMVGPKICGQENAEGIVTAPGGVEICVLDADDMLDDPAGVLKQYCDSVNLDFDQAMLKWDTPESHAFAKEQFEKWNGFHDDAINSTDLKPRVHKHVIKNDAQMYDEWIEKYGQEAADVIKETVDKNVADYEYLKQFAIKI